MAFFTSSFGIAAFYKLSRSLRFTRSRSQTLAVLLEIVLGSFGGTLFCEMIGMDRSNPLLWMGVIFGAPMGLLVGIYVAVAIGGDRAWDNPTLIIPKATRQKGLIP